MIDYFLNTMDPMKMMPSYISAIAAFIITFIIVKKIKDNSMPDNIWALPFLVATIMLILGETLFCRSAGASFQYIIKPFNSYAMLAKGDQSRLGEIAINILMMIPFGICFGIFISFDLEFWDMYLFQTVFAGSLFSLLIELVQLISKRGTFEIDDIIHNAIGTLIGYLLALAIMRIKENME